MPLWGLVFSVLVGAYIVGGIPFGLMIGKRFFNVDIREHGSRNIGATNAYRVLGKKAGAAVFILDIGKGLLPVLVARHLFPALDLWIVLTGGAAIMGHTFSPFLGFRGGKGVATSLGAAFGFSWQGAGISLITWCTIVKVTGFVSVASIFVTPLCALLTWYFNKCDLSYGVFGIVITSFVIYKHRSNIQRLLKGKELKFYEKEKDE
jgi:glycerol-3-phosphate acyltransferase PlsY